MKKVLILAYHFPPNNSIGSQRPYSWYQHFIKNQLYPIIITRHWHNNINSEIECIKSTINQNIENIKDENGTIIRIPHNPNLRDKILIKYGKDKKILLRKFLTIFYSFFEFKFKKFDSKISIYYEAEKYIKQNKINCIIATGEPFILFKYASKLSKKYSIPWIADYRDEWIKRNNSIILKPFYKILEKQLLSNCDKIISASPNYSKNLEKNLGKKVTTITNGYDDSINFKNDPIINPYFEISYVGTLYSFQPIESFFSVLNSFVEKLNIEIIFSFYGTGFYPENWERVEKIKISSKIKIIKHDRLPKVDLLNNLRKSSILLLLTTPNFITLAGKTFDYLIAKRPILLFKNDFSVLEKIILDCKSGYVCKNEQEVFLTLKKSYGLWIKHKIVPCNTSDIEKYSRKNLTKKYVSIINKIN